MAKTTTRYCVWCKKKFPDRKSFMSHYTECKKKGQAKAAARAVKEAPTEKPAEDGKKDGKKGK